MEKIQRLSLVASLSWIVSIITIDNDVGKKENDNSDDDRKLNITSLSWTLSIIIRWEKRKVITITIVED